MIHQIGLPHVSVKPKYHVFGAIPIISGIPMNVV